MADHQYASDAAPLRNRPCVAHCGCLPGLALATVGAPSVDTTYWYQQGNLTTRRGSFVLGLATAVSSDPSPPNLISISYGGTESFYTKYIGPTYIPRCNVEFQKVAARTLRGHGTGAYVACCCWTLPTVQMCARGITVLAASGDAGSCNASPDCTIGAFFPGSSPWVTAVSATFTSRHAPPRPNPSAKGVGEAAVSVLDGMAWTTGGGFSAEPTCEQPWYQKAAVAEYLARQPAGMPPASMYNASLRAYPDVSALGHNIITVTDGITQPADGTSAATPIFAGIISRLNQARKARGLAVVGFANPLLYAAREKAPSAFYDIVGPTNNRCGNYACCPYVLGVRRFVLGAPSQRRCVTQVRLRSHTWIRCGHWPGQCWQLHSAGRVCGAVSVASRPVNGVVSGVSRLGDISR